MSLKSYKTQNNILQKQLKSKNKQIENYEEDSILKNYEFEKNILDIFETNINKDREINYKIQLKELNIFKNSIESLAAVPGIREHLGSSQKLFQFILF